MKPLLEAAKVVYRFPKKLKVKPIGKPLWTQSSHGDSWCANGPGSGSNGMEVEVAPNAVTELALNRARFRSEGDPRSTAFRSFSA